MQRIILSVLNCLVIISMIWISPVLAADDEAFDEVQALVETYFVDVVDVESLDVHSARELIEQLGDPFSIYMTAAEFESFIESIEGQYAGIGVYLNENMTPEGLEIIGIIPGSPAEKAGLKTGDIIVRVDDVFIADYTVDEACGLMVGAPGSRVRLELKQEQGSRSVYISRQIISLPVVESDMLDFDTAYICVYSFSHQAGAELVETIEACRQEGADKWIIDLRGNPGGYVDAALEITGVFIGSKTAFLVEDRDGISGYTAEESEVSVDEPLIVLIDENSASASELFTAALKDYRKAVLIGNTTYGKGTVQELFPLSNGDWLKLTTARFYSPAGLEINSVGVPPDISYDSPDIITAAELLLSDPEAGGAGDFELVENGYVFVVDLSLARSSEYWQTWGEIIDHLEQLPAYRESGEQDYRLYTPKEIGDEVNIYYPDAAAIGAVDNYINGSEIVLYTSKEWNEIDIHIRNAENGAQIEADVESDQNLIKIKPADELLPGEYWIILDAPDQTSYLAVIRVGA